MSTKNSPAMIAPQVNCGQVASTYAYQLILISSLTLRGGGFGEDAPPPHGKRSVSGGLAALQTSHICHTCVMSFDIPSARLASRHSYGRHSSLLALAPTLPLPTWSMN